MIEQEEELIRENEALKVLTHAEDVLRKRIRAMKDGAPLWAAQERIEELQEAKRVLKLHYAEPVYWNFG